MAVWSRGLVTEMAKHYSSRSELFRMRPGAYDFAKRHGMLDDLFGPAGKFGGFYPASKKYKTDDVIRRGISGIETADKLKDFNKPLYNMLKGQGRLDEFFTEEHRQNPYYFQFSDGLTFLFCSCMYTARRIENGAKNV